MNTEQRESFEDLLEFAREGINLAFLEAPSPSASKRLEQAIARLRQAQDLLEEM